MIPIQVHPQRAATPLVLLPEVGPRGGEGKAGGRGAAGKGARHKQMLESPLAQLCLSVALCNLQQAPETSLQARRAGTLVSAKCNSSVPRTAGTLLQMAQLALSEPSTESVGEAPEAGAASAVPELGGLAPTGLAPAGWVVGYRLEAKDQREIWCEAEVVGLRGEGAAAEVMVHYAGWTQRWDEWLPRCSRRLRPLTSSDAAAEGSRGEGAADAGPPARGEDEEAAAGDEGEEEERLAEEEVSRLELLYAATGTLLPLAGSARWEFGRRAPFIRYDAIDKAFRKARTDEGPTEPGPISEAEG